MAGPTTELTLLLNAVGRGETERASDLLPAVYAELRRLAAAKMAREAPGNTLQATALVHEAWLRLQKESGEPPSDRMSEAGQPPDHEQRWRSRAHFFSAAAEAMRRILIESARKKKALRHGGGQERVDITEVEIALLRNTNEDDLLAVHEALDKLAAQDPQKAELVKLRYFVGLTVEEAANILDISTPTAKRYWAFARAWLYQEINKT
ncbi:ECF-type sigma factor [Verrucomicrobiota bacterium sgz303538]